jgi:hypothetical protein
MHRLTFAIPNASAQLTWFGAHASIGSISSLVLCTGPRYSSTPFKKSAHSNRVVVWHIILIWSFAVHRLNEPVSLRLMLLVINKRFEPMLKKSPSHRACAVISRSYIMLPMLSEHGVIRRHPQSDRSYPVSATD